MTKQPPKTGKRKTAAGKTVPRPAPERKAKPRKSAAPKSPPRKTRVKVSAPAAPPAAVDPEILDPEPRPRQKFDEPESEVEALDDADEPQEEGLAVEAEPEIPETVTSLAPMPARAIEKISLLQRYLAEVRRYPLLTPEEEKKLTLLYHERGDLAAARQLVTSNLRLVVKIALEYYRNWMDLLDLVQEGNVGLMQAVKKFDPYRGNRLSTYASFWIRAYILKFLMDNWRLVKIGTTQAQRKLFFNLKKERERLEQFGYKPGPRMLAESLEVKESEVVEMDQRLGSRDESLDLPVTEDGKQTRAMVLAADQPAIDDLLSEYELAMIIKRKLKEFRKELAQPGKEKEAFIFDRRLLAEDPLTLQEVAEQFDISRERIRQLEARLVKRIKQYLKKELPDFEDYDFIST